jgi:tRNA G46 methylase TrmB
MPIFLADYISIVRSQLSQKLNEEITNTELKNLYFVEVPAEVIVSWLVAGKQTLITLT